MVNSNAILYSAGEHPDHVVVIKYVPYVADSKCEHHFISSKACNGCRWMTW